MGVSFQAQGNRDSILELAGHTGGWIFTLKFRDVDNGGTEGAVLLLRDTSRTLLAVGRQSVWGFIPIVYANTVLRASKSWSNRPRSKGGMVSLRRLGK
jgi:hypothetical protein